MNDDTSLYDSDRWEEKCDEQTHAVTVKPSSSAPPVLSFSITRL